MSAQDHKSPIAAPPETNWWGVLWWGFGAIFALGIVIGSAAETIWPMYKHGVELRVEIARVDQSTRIQGKYQRTFYRYEYRSGPYAGRTFESRERVRSGVYDVIVLNDRYANPMFGKKGRSLLEHTTMHMSGALWFTLLIAFPAMIWLTVKNWNGT